MIPAALLINPVPSRWQRGFLLLLHGTAAGAALSLAWPLNLIVGVWVWISAVWHWRQRSQIRLIQCLPDGVCMVHYLDGHELAMALQPTSVLTAHVLVLHLQGDGVKLAVLLWPDSADAEVLRQWRVYLRWIWPSLQRSRTKPEIY